MNNSTEDINAQIIHAIAGRIRLKNNRLQRDNNYTQKLQELVKSLEGVSDVRISPATASIIVSYNHKLVDNKTFKTELANCLQQASSSNSALVKTQDLQADTAKSNESTEEIISPSVEKVEPSENSLQQASSSTSAIVKIPNIQADTAKSDESTDEIIPPIVEKVEQNITQVLQSSSGIDIPQECLNRIDEFPVNVNQQREVFEIGIPAFCILQPLNSKLEELATENEKATELQIINLDFKASFIEEGLLINGEAKGKFREHFFTNPFTKHPYYTPWVSLSAVGIAELETNVVDETLNVNLANLKISGKRGKWYKKLIDFGLENFFKAKLVSKINEYLSQFNGEKIQQLFFDIKGDERLRANSQDLGMTSEKLDALLSLVQVNMRIAPDYLWLSVKL